MDRHRWLKYTAQLSNICGASPINNKILLFDGHGSHFNNGALRKMNYTKIQPFLLKVGNNINDQNNDNVPNAKLKSLYNMAKSVWMLKYGATKFSPHQMKSVLVEAWDTFKVSDGKIIRDSFKKMLLPLRPPNLIKIPRHTLPTSKYLLEPRLKKSKYITPYSCAYQVTSNQDWWSYGCHPS